MRQSVARQPHLPRRRRRWIGLAVAAAVAIVLLATNAPQGTFASWRQADSSEGTVTIGSFSFQMADVSGGNASPGDPQDPSAPQYTFTPLDQAAGDMLPGSTYAAPVKVTNTGSAPLTLAITAAHPAADTAEQQALAAAVGLAVLRNPGTCNASAFTSATFVPLGQMNPEQPLALVGADAPLAPGESTPVCVALRLAATAPTGTQGQALPITLDLRADQHR